ncbi:hypothetical protein SBRCBS47491_001144 [Sporothrix bragantina]|uniref:CWH43-like N-terminal domain-containing protein n=1 Tax=Sporothrix bragantina TaxID=671064 RepID=A0ABP0AW56_9PEZI
MIYRPSYFLLPILSGCVWLGMLLGMLIGWVVDTHREHYVSMDANQHVAYISDIGASPKFKPMFIALCVVTTVTLDLSFLADRWLRHAGRLTANNSRGQKVLGVLTIIFAIIGTAGLILLSVFDVAHHKNLHDGFLLCFLGGYVISAICICWEYQRLGIHNRDKRVLRVSFWIKLTFVLVEIVLAIIFVSLTFTNHTNGGAIVEWIIAFIFAFYIFSFAIDLYPAVHTRNIKHRIREKADDMKGGHNGTAGHMSDSTMVQDGPVTVSEMEATNANGGYRGYGVGGANNNASTAQGNVPSGYYDTTYGESAARATRSPRANKTAVGSAFVEDSLRTNGHDGLQVNEPQQAYQPSRTYQ